MKRILLLLACLATLTGVFAQTPFKGRIVDEQGQPFPYVNVVLLLGLTIYVLRAKTWKKLALNTNIDSKIQFFDEERIAVGDTGRTITRLAPMGMARIGEESCEVKSLEGIIDPGTEIEVVMIEDNRIYVKPVENDY